MAMLFVYYFHCKFIHILPFAFHCEFIHIHSYEMLSTQFGAIPIVITKRIFVFGTKNLSVFSSLSQKVSAALSCAKFRIIVRRLPDRVQWTSWWWRSNTAIGTRIYCQCICAGIIQQQGSDLHSSLYYDFIQLTRIVCDRSPANNYMDIVLIIR